ncbi:MAG: esterase-like activity of phytase family protein [Psychroflexus sp.]|nr:esterase-like activity of phytase family protein [Psychroflexus sp.]
MAANFAAFFMTQFFSKSLCLLCLFSLVSCQTYRIKKHDKDIISFLDETTVSDKQISKFPDFGGISGLDYLGNDTYILVADVPSNPRLYKAEIKIAGHQISSFEILEKIELDIPKEHQNQVFDLESIRYDEKNDLYFVGSEGRISAENEGFVMTLNSDFEIVNLYDSLPHYSVKNSRNNGLFEGVSTDIDHKGFWFVNELPLKTDGSKPGLINSFSPIRMSYFDLEQEKITEQYAIDLGRVSKTPLLPFMINGVTDILQLNKNQFLFLERAFSAGHGNKGNNVRVFIIDISKATDILKHKDLKAHKKDIQLADKKLIFDFKSVKKKLTSKIIDNIEGISFGPVLPSGEQSLLLMSDDNFSSYSDQINQVVLLKLNL